MIHAFYEERRKRKSKSAFEIDGVHAYPSFRDRVRSFIRKREAKLNFIREPESASNIRQVFFRQN